MQHPNLSIENKIETLDYFKDLEQEDGRDPFIMFVLAGIQMQKKGKSYRSFSQRQK